MSLAFDDAVLDRLAARTRRPSSRGSHHRAGEDPADRVSELFAQWQDRLTARPAPAPLDSDRAAQLIASAPRRSALRPALAIAAAICVLLVGSAAIGARTARPGDPLFPVTQVLWSQQADSAVAGQQIRDIIDNARHEVSAGRLAHAAELLRQADRELVRVTSQDDHAEVQGDLMAVWAMLTKAGSESGAASGSDLAAGAPPVTAALAGTAGAPPAAAGTASTDPRSAASRHPATGPASPGAATDDRAGVGIAGATSVADGSPDTSISTAGAADPAPPGTSAAWTPSASAPPATAVTAGPATSPTAAATSAAAVPTTAPTAVMTTAATAITTATAAATGSTTTSPAAASPTQVPVSPSPTTSSAPAAPAPTTSTSDQAAMTGQALAMPGAPVTSSPAAAPTTGTAAPTATDPPPGG